MHNVKIKQASNGQAYRKLTEEKRQVIGDQIKKHKATLNSEQKLNFDRHFRKLGERALSIGLDGGQHNPDNFGIFIAIGGLVESNTLFYK